MPALRLPLRGAASVVAFSRVYTGVHYPSDVLVGAIVGAVLGRAASTVARRGPGLIRSHSAVLGVLLRPTLKRTDRRPRRS